MTAAVELRLDDQLCFALYSASHSIVRAYRPLLAELGLTYPQYLVLMSLWEHDDVTVQEIGRRLDLPANGVTPVVRRLADTGLVTRAGDPADGRVVRVRLTSAGVRMERTAAGAQTAVLERTGLSPAALESLRGTLLALARTISDDHVAGGDVDAAGAA